MANRNFASGGKLYSMHVMPVQIDCNFVVTPTDPTGITSLKGPTVHAVYMNTSATPSAGNPNPAAGTILVQLADNYNRLYIADTAIISPNSGSDVKVDNSALTPGVAYTITTLGNSTAAALHAIGVPSGITPVVGVSFIATAVGAGANTSTTRVQATAAAGSGVATIEIVGNTNTTLSPSQLLQTTGAQIILQCRDYAGALVAPAVGTTIAVRLLLSNSSVLIQGE